ncbi:MAG: hypothetical protein J5883_01600 [Clostridiales bacterium]|nr:hypothetical protein [Clostridiales bacterium]
MHTVKRVVSKMRFDAGCWMVIAIFQIVLGIPLILVFGYGISMILCGIWNLYAVSQQYKRAKTFLKYPSMIYPYFRDSLNAILIMIAVNFFFGGIIGVIGGLYDLSVRDYVLKHEKELKAACAPVVNNEQI